MLIAALSTAEILGMAGFSSFAALLPLFTREWGLSAAEAGISGAYYGGYTAAVPVLVTLTDRIDARRIYLLATALGGAAILAFAIFADGFWSALLLRAVAGIGLAGTYMPGLKALTDRIGGTAQARAVGFYTASFGIGGSVSYVLAGFGEAMFGWRAAFAIAALGSALAYGIATKVLRPLPVTQVARQRVSESAALGAVLRNGMVIACIIGYTALNFQLFGFRSWIVAFLSFSTTLQASGALHLDPPFTAAAVTIVSVPASIIGNEIALKFGYRSTIISSMSLAAAFSCLFGFTATLPYLLVILASLLYGILVSGVGSALTSALVAHTDQRYRGAVMAIYSSIGFAGASLAPIIFGIALDLLGTSSVLGWGIGFAVLGVGASVGPLAFLLLVRQHQIRLVTGG
jgi:MFS family permease